MNDLKEALFLCLNDILSRILEKPYVVLKKELQKVIITGTNSLKTEYIQIPDYSTSFYRQASIVLDSYDFNDINNLIEKKYPFLNGQVGTRAGSRGYNAKRWVSKLTSNILKSPVVIDDLSLIIDSQIEAFKQMITKRIYTMIVYLPILNLRLSSPPAQIQFTKDIILKELNEDELTDLFQNPYGLPDFSELSWTALIITYQDDIIFRKEDKKLRNDPMTVFNDKIENILRSLNLVSRGSFDITSRFNRIQGYFASFADDSVHKSFKTVKGMISTDLSVDQLSRCQSIYHKLCNIGTDSFDIALSKLRDAETRLSDQDSIIDAVIGLESLLLNDIGNEKNRGELKYRFSTNYSTLFSPIDRLIKYYEAKETYDVRSMIVHAGKIEPNKLKCFGKILDIKEVKKIIVDQLREVIKILFDIYDSQPFDTDKFWLNRVLGIENLMNGNNEV